MKLKNGFAFILSVCVLLSGSFGFAEDSARQTVTQMIQAIPDAFVAARADAPYGTYQSVVSNNAAREFQKDLSILENKLHALAAFLDKKEKAQAAEILFVLESEILRRHLDVIEGKVPGLTAFEKQSFSAATIRLYQQLRFTSERYYHDMIRFIDVALPGPNGLQIRTDINDMKSVYASNYRRDNILSPLEQATEYKKKLDEFVKKGGQLNEMFILNKQKVGMLPNFSRMEYVQLKNGTIHATFGTAGHILLAEGKPVQTAGQILMIKDPAGKISLLVITNASGSYKPDVVSTQELARKLSKTYNINPASVLVTLGEPLSTQIVKIYMKGSGVAQADIRAKADELEKTSKEILSKPAFQPRPLNCRNLMLAH